MKKLLAALQNMRLQTKLILSVSLLIILQSVVQSLLFFRTATNQIMENTSQSMVDAIEKNTALSDTVLYAAISSSISYDSDPDLRHLLELMEHSASAMQVAELEARLYRRYFWDLDDEVFSVHLVAQGKDSTHGGATLTFEEFQTAFPEYRDYGDEFYWTPTHLAKELGLDEDVATVSAIRRLSPAPERPPFPRNPPYGSAGPDLYLVVNLRPETLYQYYNSSLPTENSAFLVATPQGEWVAGEPRGLLEDHSILEMPWFGDSLRENGVGRYRAWDRDFIVCHATSQINGWTAFLMVPTHELTGELYAFGRLVLLLNNAISLVVLGAIYVLSRHFMHPMRELARFARQISSGDLEPPAKRHRGGDLGVISDTIHLLNSWLKRLMEQNSDISRREQEATVAALEMQLNPHFLFNTLNSINLLAIKNGQKEISGTITDLSGMLHYTLDQRNRFVQLSGELEFLERYLSLMRARFNNRFTVSYDIEEETRECILPKMILQICVENAILHGIRDLPPSQSGEIIVRARLQGAHLVLQVQDNGKGFSAEELRRVHSGRDDKKSHLGFSNINQRLKLLFGEGYGISIVSWRNPTIVEITMPTIRYMQLPLGTDNPF